MPSRQFNGREVAFLTGNDDDESPSRVVHSEKLGVEHDGYEVERVVVKHPDGRFYQFDFKYEREHGIMPCREWPDELTEAIEVEPVAKKITTYKPKS